MRSFLCRFFYKSSPRKQRRSICRQWCYARPKLEELEGRIVLDAYVFATPAGVPNSGSWMSVQLWSVNGAVALRLPGPSDTAIIPGAANCTLDNSNTQTVAGLTVGGALNVYSDLTVTGTANLGGGGALSMNTPNISGVSSYLTVSTLFSGISSGTNLVIQDGATVEVQNSGNLTGTTLINGGVMQSDNTVTFVGPTKVLDGPIPGNLVAEGSGSFTIANGGTTFGTGATVGGGGPFFIDGALTVNEALTVSDDPFYLQPATSSTPTGSIGGTGSIDW